MNNWFCCVCGKPLSEKFVVDGKDYCQRHKPPRRASVWDEHVRGIVIGDMGQICYQFWQGGKKIAETEAENDSRAIAWFKHSYPDVYAQGAEMRAFDG